MDGLRLALIIAGIVVVAAVYWWTARRRRVEREAGQFDRFDAWTDDSLDPLSDADTDTLAQPNPRLGPLADPRSPAPPDGDPDPDADVDRSSATQPNPRFVLPADDVDETAEPLRDPAVLQGLEAIAESLDTRPEPTLGDVEGVATSRGGRDGAAVSPRRSAASTPPADRDAARSAARQAPPAGAAELVVVINVMAPVGGTFDGPPLREALENAGLKAGDMKLYHFHAEAQPPGTAPIFSALNVVKPGTLAPEQFAGMRTPGVALVMRLPGPERPVEAFELMHGTATAMAAELGGRLCDETRSALTRQALTLMRERIADLARRQRAGG